MYWNLTDKERFATALTLADNPKLLAAFLDDFFTKKEIAAYELRLRAMCMLSDGATYKQIRSATKLGPSTIARLSKSMNDRENGVRKILRKFTKKGKPYYD